jgi:putative tricarboxylic transport membrane protein
MEVLQHIMQGFSISFQPTNLLYCFIGVLAGTLIGVIPGVGPVTGIALLIPMSFGINPISAIVMMAGIYYGSQYGGSTTSILLSVPGEPSSVVTCFDGYQMALQGRAGSALGIAAFGSFIGGSIGIIGMAFIAPPLAGFALKFGPAELFSVMILGISIISYVARVSVRKAVIVSAFGLIIASVGQDLVSGERRFIFGISELQEGIDMIPVVMGLYGITEILLNVESTLGSNVFKEKVKNILPSFEDWQKSIFAIFRGTGIGFLCGIIPGAGPTVSTFCSYGIEKKISKHPERFGKGAIEGVAAPETANNAASQASFIPLLTLGIPTTATAAILLGALMIHGITPGPSLISKYPELFWGLTTSMWVGNLMLLILNLPLIGIWVKILKIPYIFLVPNILLFCIIGSYCLRNTYIDVLIMLVFGVIGYLMNKFDYEPAPMVMTLVLGPKLEESLRQSLILSGGSFNIFFSSSISIIALGLAAFLLISAILAKKRLAIGYE